MRGVDRRPDPVVRGHPQRDLGLWCQRLHPGTVRTQRIAGSSGSRVPESKDQQAPPEPATPVPAAPSLEIPIEVTGAKLRSMMPWIQSGKIIDKTKN